MRLRLMSDAGEPLVDPGWLCFFLQRLPLFAFLFLFGRLPSATATAEANAKRPRHLSSQQLSAI